VTSVIGQWSPNNCVNCQHSPSCFFFSEMPKICGPFSYGSSSSCNGGATVGISQLSQPSRSKICRIWRSGFYIDGCTTVRTVALSRANLKWKTGFATISSGQIYHSMVLSQPPSCDTVPLHCCIMHYSTLLYCSLLGLFHFFGL
jgi:hypothetical protein